MRSAGNGRRAGGGQLTLPLEKRSPRRRRRRGQLGRVPHRARPVHKGRHPVHVTLRARSGLPSLRQQLVHALVLRVLAAQRKRSYKDAFQIVHLSIQANHIHMLVEADDGPTGAPSTRRKNALRSGVSGFVIALARRLNALLHRKGKVWDDRYHRHDLASPHEVRTSLRYVLANFRKHQRVFGVGADPFSSGQHFDGWSEPLVAVFPEPEPWPDIRARTWLLRKGWRIHGLIGPWEVPGQRA